MGRDPLDVDLPHDIGDVIFDSELDSPSKVRLTFEIYKDIPTYWLIALIALYWDELPNDAKKVFWGETKKYLSHNNLAFVNPLGYALAVDFFEDQKRLEEAWGELVRSNSNKRVNMREQTGPNKQLLERLQKFSGPLPPSYTKELRELISARPNGTRTTA